MTVHELVQLARIENESLRPGAGEVTGQNLWYCSGFTAVCQNFVLTGNRNFENALYMNSTDVTKSPVPYFSTPEIDHGGLRRADRACSCH